MPRVYSVDIVEIDLVVKNQYVKSFKAHIEIKLRNNRVFDQFESLLAWNSARKTSLAQNP